MMDRFRPYKGREADSCTNVRVGPSARIQSDQCVVYQSVSRPLHSRCSSIHDPEYHISSPNERESSVDQEEEVV